MSSPASTSPLSSVRSDITVFDVLETNVKERLNSYHLTSTNDPVVIVLEGFIKGLSDDGLENLFQDILSCASDGELRSLVNNLTTALLLPMKARGKTPIASPSPRPGAESCVERIASELEPSSRKEQAWLKAACLRRDNNRCVITGFYDNNEAEKNLSPSERLGVTTGSTEVAHILPLSLGSFRETERLNTATIWESMYRYFPSISSSFAADKINNTENAMTMDAGLHSAFGKFQLAFHSIGNNVYHLKKYPKCPTMHNLYIPSNNTVTLVAHSSDSLPSPSLLKIHAAIADILFMTGMGDYIENILREQQVIRCLASDGTTSVASLLMVF